MYSPASPLGNHSPYPESFRCSPGTGVGVGTPARHQTIVKGRSRLIVTFFCVSPSLGLDHVLRDYGHSLGVKKEYLGFLSNLDTLSVLHYLISKKGVCAMCGIVLP